MGQFDDTMKQLMGESPQALVSFLLAGAKYLGDLDRELKTRTIKADLLCRVRWNGELIVLHVEFQRYHDSGMPRRVWKYNALTSIITGKPVCSVVLYLVKDQSITRPFYRARFRNGRTIHWFFFRQIKLWELPPDVFEQPQLAGLLPLLPLTKDGQNRDTVDRMIRKMLEAGKEDILWLAEAFAGLVLTSADDKRWIKGRFHTMLDILKRSWVYQETIEEGEGIGLGKAILQFVEFRFPTLLSLAKQVIKQKMSAEQLEVMLKTLYRANTVEEARTLLLTEE